MADYPPPQLPSRMRWRQGAGRGNTCTVYAQAGATPHADDDVICVAGTPELAVHIVAAHNSMLRIGGPVKSG